MPGERTRVLHRLLLTTLLLAFATSSAASTIGLYTDGNGSSCSFSGNNPGVVTAYVVVKPDAQGVRAVRFSAPVPSCFGAVFLTESAPSGASTIGSSETGISVAFPFCAPTTSYALQIQYMRTSTTPCCEFTIAADPIVGMIEGLDCNYVSSPMTPVVSHFNADASCPCNDLTPPLPPENPSPADGLTSVSVQTTFSWAPSPYDADIASYDFYMGTNPTPDFVMTTTNPGYQPPQPLQELTQYYWRVVVRDDDGHETTGPLWRFTTRAINSPPGVPHEVFPPNFATAVSAVPTLQWFATDVDGDALEYDIHLGVEPDLPLLVDHLNASAYTISPALAYSTTYSWYVTVRDAVGHETTGPTWTFTTRPSNYPPNPPTSPSPANNATNVVPTATLSWSASDIDAGQSLTYDVYFGASNPPPLALANTSVKTYTPQGMNYASSYFWKIVVRDDHGAEAAGPVWKFTTRPSNFPPAAPSIPSPSDLATSVSNSVALAWQCSDPDGDPIKYDVYFGVAATPPLVASAVSSRSYNPGFLAVGTRYYWRILARDATGAETSGPVWSFTTAANHAPGAPSNPVPANTATNQTPQLRLVWSCTDADAGQVLSFDVYFGLSSLPPLVASNQTDKFWDTPFLDVNKTYFWKIVAKDPLGASTTGAIWRFSTGSALPAPSNPFPANGAAVFSSPVTLQWSAAAQLTSFQIYFGTTVPPPSLGTSNTPSFNSGALVPGTQYYWYVLATDGISSVIGPLWSFYVSGGGVPVLFSRFEATAHDGAVALRWELQSDEAMQSYTLFRHTDGSSPSVPIATAPVTGTVGSYLDGDVEAGKTYRYEMLVRTTDGGEFRSQTATVEMPSLELTLGPNHPNPFNPQTAIPYAVPAGAPVHVRLVIFDTQGRAVRVLVNEDQRGGAREVVWNGTDESGSTVSSGIYFCVLQVGKERRTQKLVLLK